MYTRNYQPDTQGILIPDNYDGTALTHDDPIEGQEREDTEAIHTSKEAREFSRGESEKSFFSTLPFGDLLSRWFGNGKFGLQSIGFEEILIAGIALYLLFSKDGDKECAIVLLILLFIT